MRVLILEQEKTVRQSLTNFMERYKGFEVFAAHSWREGVSLFNKVPFDMVLCGHRLPDGDGLDILRGLMEQNPKLVSILMTVHSDEVLRQKALKAGVCGYLEKPFDLKQLEEAIGLEGPEFKLSNKSPIKNERR
ncbi:MAG: response regulator [Thermodesulfobacteriota bacterium]